MSESEFAPESSEEESAEERIFNMMQSVIKEMKDTWRIENLSNIELVHLKRIVRETLESRDQIEGMRQQMLADNKEGVKVTKKKNADIGSTVEAEVIIRWLDQLYGINPVQIPDFFRQSYFYQVRLDDKTTGEVIILRSMGIEYLKYDEESKMFKTVKKNSFYTKKEYYDMFDVIEEEEERRNSLGHELTNTQSHDDRLLDYINQQREEAHLM